ASAVSTRFQGGSARETARRGRLGFVSIPHSWENGVTTTLAEATVPEKILLAAHQLEEQGRSPFSAEELIVKAWERFPKTFGLKGFADQHPDSNKVLSSIMGEKGLARRGWLAKMGQKLYALTREGRHVVRRLSDDDAAAPGTAVPSPRKLPREQESFILNLLNSTATQKYQEGIKQELTFAEACRFWDISEKLHGDALDARLARVRRGLTDLERQLGPDGVDLRNGRNVSAEDI